jgi:hypothetical protein
MTYAEQPSVTFRPAAFLAGKPGSRSGHLPFVYDLVFVSKPSLIVELGVYFGDTYFSLCQAVAEHNLSCSCYGVDSWQGDAETGPYDNSVFNAVNRYNEKRYRSFSYLVRKNFQDALPLFSDESIGLLHIDGLHSYEATKADFETWLPKVSPGGLILLSDVSRRGSAYGTWRLWEELQGSYQTFLFRNHDGLGVLRKPGGEEIAPFLKDLFAASKAEQERIRRYYMLCAERLDFAEKAGAGNAADGGHSIFQVHTSRAGKYETNDDLRIVIEPASWTNVCIRLPDGVGDGPLRVDLASRTAVIEIAGITLRKMDGKIAWAWTPKDDLRGIEIKGTAVVLPSGGSLSVLSYGTEPRLYLPAFSGAASVEALELEMRIRVDAELAAVRELSVRWSALHLEISQLKMEAERAKLTAGQDEEKRNAESAAKIKEISDDVERRLTAMRDDFEREKTQMAIAFEDERKQHLAVLADRDHMAALHPRLSQEAAIARGNVEDLQAEIERLNALQTQLEGDVMDLRKLNARLAAALDMERQARSSMEESSSWQLTKPLRAVTEIFGSRRR